jgi:hypothetical protein
MSEIPTKTSRKRKCAKSSSAKSADPKYYAFLDGPPTNTWRKLPFLVNCSKLSRFLLEVVNMLHDADNTAQLYYRVVICA